MAELAVAAYLVSGLTFSAAGVWAPWMVLAAWGVGAVVRAADLQAWALLVPGGATGRIRRAFGERFTRAATAVAIAERLLFAALAALIVGSYAATAPVAAPALASLTAHLTVLDV